MELFFTQSDGVLFQGPQSPRCAQIIAKMAECGTRVVACAYPYMAEHSSSNLAWYCSVSEACDKHPDLRASIIVSHPSQVKSLALEAIDSGIKIVVIVSDYVPVHDCLVIAQEATFQRVQVIGPGSQGILIPGRGMIGSLMLNNGFPPVSWLTTGPIAIVTRSAGLGLFVTYALKKEGHGISFLVDIGYARARCGLGFDDVLALLDNDSNCRIALIIPEINSLDYNAVVKARERGLFSKPILTIIPENQTCRDHYLKQSYQLVSSNMIIEKLKEVDIHVLTMLENIPQAIAEALKNYHE